MNRRGFNPLLLALLPALLALMAQLVTGCDQTPSTPSAAAGSTTHNSVIPQKASGKDPYADAVAAMTSHGVKVWIETDLVAAWHAGSARFAAVGRRAGTLAALPGVLGVKIADEIGYRDGLTSPAQVTEFLSAARAELAKDAPGKQLLVDVVIPEMGCLAWEPSASAAQKACAEQARSAYPGATIDGVTGWIGRHYVDVVDVSSGLQTANTYATWGTDLATAQRAVWSHVQSLGWGSGTRLQARKALAVDGGWAGSASQAQADLTTYVDEPIAGGATGVDIWTWCQPYRGGVASLLSAPPADPATNPLWVGLVARHAQGVPLLTHFTPSCLRENLAADTTLFAQAFTGAFVAAGSP